VVVYPTPLLPTVYRTPMGIRFPYQVCVSKPLPCLRRSPQVPEADPRAEVALVESLEGQFEICPVTALDSLSSLWVPVHALPQQPTTAPTLRAFTWRWVK
jgi:hypothetical protein